MKIIFDSGSSSVAFAIIRDDSGVVTHTIKTGHNAASAPEGALAALLSGCEMIVEAAGRIDEVEYYGAGCARPEACDMVRRELESVFPSSDIKVESDMLCAARAIFHDAPGIACILGTGANSCLWNGERIVSNVSPLGYILGDEGSGAVLGRLFLGRMFKGQFPGGVAGRFDRRYGLTSGQIIGEVYRGSRPGAFLASFAPFILEEARQTREVADFVVDEFRRFLKYNVASYEEAQTLPVGFVGSVAWYFKDYLEQAVGMEGYRMGRILRAPLDSLVDYSLSKVQ